MAEVAVSKLMELAIEWAGSWLAKLILSFLSRVARRSALALASA